MKHNREKSHVLRHHELWFRSDPKRKKKKSRGLHPQYKVIEPPPLIQELQLHPLSIRRKTSRNQIFGIFISVLIIVLVIAAILQIFL